MAGRTRDLAGATFGEPWQARTREGLPVKPPTWRIGATFPNGERLTVARRGRTDAEAFGRIDALRKRPYGSNAGTSWTMQRIWDDWWTSTSEESQVAQRTLSDGAVSRSPSTWQDATRLRYKGIWTRHLADKWAHRDPATITRAEISDWLKEPRSVRPKMLVDALRIVCRHAEEIGAAPMDPTRGGFRLTTRRPVPRPLSLDQLTRIEEHLKTLKASPRQPDSERLLDGWIILRASAARISEMLSLQVQDFDQHSGTLAIGRRHLAKTISLDGRSTIALVEGTKTKAGVRRVPIGAEGRAVLVKRCAGRAPTDFIIANSSGRWVSTNSFSNGLFREMRKIGIEATAHDLRDTLSTSIARDMVERRGLAAGLLAAARHLGHASPRSLPAYVDESQVDDPEVARSVAESDLGPRRLSEVLEAARRAGLYRHVGPSVSAEGDVLVLRIQETGASLADWRSALVAFDRVRVELAAPMEDIRF